MSSKTNPNPSVYIATSLMNEGSAAIARAIGMAFALHQQAFHQRDRAAYDRLHTNIWQAGLLIKRSTIPAIFLPESAPPDTDTVSNPLALPTPTETPRPGNLLLPELDRFTNHPCVRQFFDHNDLWDGTGTSRSLIKISSLMLLVSGRGEDKKPIPLDFEDSAVQTRVNAILSAFRRNNLPLALQRAQDQEGILKVVSLFAEYLGSSRSYMLRTDIINL